MRLNNNPALPSSPDSAYAKDLNFRLQAIFRDIANKVNFFADGRLSAVDNALTTAPTTGQYAQGDFVRNSAPTVLGTLGSQYTIAGWRCVAGGTPGTFVQCRELTGT